MLDAATPQLPPVRDDAFDYDAYVAEHWPTLPAPQASSVATYIYLGWTVIGLGRADEINVEKTASFERGYVRTDGLFRTA